MRTQYKTKSLFNEQGEGVKLRVVLRHNPITDSIGFETTWLDPTTMYFKPTGKRIRAPYAGGMHRHHIVYDVNDPFNGVELMSISDHMKTHEPDRTCDELGRFN